MKIKWNWLDTLIVCIVVALIVVGAVFFLSQRPDAVIQTQDSYLYITFDTVKARLGTYDDLKVGDEIMISTNGKSFGEIIDVNILPSRTSVFNENTKKNQIFENEKYPYCRFTVKVKGYINDKNEAYADSKAVLYDDEWFLETTSLRVVANVTGIKEVSADE